ncbi:MAG TPA: hypothetical protein VFW11_24360, partial [Cyclobacteriaceae bacterium]|nr:hypothetical protein [Cyclobacteriaceae bacterium]
REIRFLVMIQCREIHNIKAFAEAFVSNMIEPAGTVWNANSDSLTIAFRIMRDAFDFTSALHQHLKSKSLLPEAKIVVHVGPVVILENESHPIHGDQLDIMNQLAAIAVAGNSYATDSLAMTASLPPGSYSFEYAGRVDIDNLSITQDLFRIHL